MGRTNRPARLAARDSEDLDSAWGTRVAPASNVPLFFRKLRRSMFSPWDRYYLLPRIIVSLRIHCCIGPGVATPSSQLNLGRSAGYELSHRGLDQLFDPSAPEIALSPARLSSTIAGRTPRLTRSIILFRDAPIGHVALFWKALCRESPALRSE